MADFYIVVTGLQETILMLEEMPRDVVALGFAGAAQAAANVIADEMEALTPIKKEDTGGLLDRGELRESLMTSVELDSNLRGVRAQVGFGKNGHVALWLEYGHRLVSHKLKGKTLIGIVPAHPFMRAAADTSAEAAIEAFAQSLAQTVKNNYPQARAA